MCVFRTLLKEEINWTFTSEVQDHRITLASRAGDEHPRVCAPVAPAAKIRRCFILFATVFSSSISRLALPAVADLRAAVLGYNEGRCHHRFQSDLGIGFALEAMMLQSSATLQTGR